MHDICLVLAIRAASRCWADATSYGGLQTKSCLPIPLQEHVVAATTVVGGRSTTESMKQTQLVANGLQAHYRCACGLHSSFTIVLCVHGLPACVWCFQVSCVVSGQGCSAVNLLSGQADKHSG